MYRCWNDQPVVHAHTHARPESCNIQPQSDYQDSYRHHDRGRDDEFISPRRRDIIGFSKRRRNDTRLRPIREVLRKAEERLQLSEPSYRLVKSFVHRATPSPAQDVTSDGWNLMTRLRNGRRRSFEIGGLGGGIIICIRRVRTAPTFTR
jgi:hypothetical protein